MTVEARGTVYLGGERFTTDPQVYEPLQWPKRATVHPGLQGALTVQDFGTYAKDNSIHLASGSSGYMEQSVVAAIHTKYRIPGASYTLTDWMGNEFTVFILEFTATPTFIGTLCTYSITLQVLGITKLFGSSYTGS
jgi:hypothetical protein